MIRFANRDLRGLKLHTGSETISHQQFVDDTILMGHSSVQEAWVMKKCLNTFSRVSELEVNNTKYQILFFNTTRIN